MRAALPLGLLALSLLLPPLVNTQAATVTATCKDGTTFSAPSRSGACKGHHGVASWGSTAAAAGTAAPAAKTTPTTTPPPAATAKQGAPAGTNTAAGKTSGGPGQVWANPATKVYHCQGDRYYGKTKKGEFMSLSAAKTAGYHPAAGKACAS